MKSKFPRPIVLGLALAATVPFLPLGCGDSAKIEDAVVVPDPAAPSSKPATPTPASTPAPVKAEEGPHDQPRQGPP